MVGDGRVVGTMGTNEPEGADFSTHSSSSLDCSRRGLRDRDQVLRGSRLVDRLRFLLLSRWRRPPLSLSFRTSFLSFLSRRLRSSSLSIDEDETDVERPRLCFLRDCWCRSGDLRGTVLNITRAKQEENAHKSRAGARGDGGQI